jgi:hypothetical protein
MRDPKSKVSKFFETIAIDGFAVLVVGLLMGGIYSMPALRLCKGHEPWLSVLLAAGLAVTVFGLGYLAETRILFSTGGWILSVILLLAARRRFGTLDGNLERFGLVNASALLVALLLAMLTRHGVSGNG